MEGILAQAPSEVDAMIADGAADASEAAAAAPSDAAVAPSGDDSLPHILGRTRHLGTVLQTRKKARTASTR